MKTIKDYLEEFEKTFFPMLEQVWDKETPLEWIEKSLKEYGEEMFAKGHKVGEDNVIRIKERLEK